jgi:hypothetical protein
MYIYTHWCMHACMHDPIRLVGGVTPTARRLPKLHALPVANAGAWLATGNQLFGTSSS